MRLGRRDALLVALAATAVLVVVAPALAQAPPPAFGPRPPAPTGITGWILEQQVQFYRQLSATVRAIRAGNSGAFWTLVSLSFLYGVFHAAGPGHGKAVISSYIVATGETVRRGVTLAALSSLVQALTAIALIFAVFLTNPAPICVLDEVDAPLDDANVERYCDLLDDMARTTDTRFVVITHNPITMSRMDRLFGVTMAERGVSTLVSVDLGRAEQLIAAE